MSEPREGEEPSQERVLFRSYRGISPTLYQRVFAYRKRKDAYGAIATWDPEEAIPVGAVSNAVRPEFEAFVANQIARTLELIHNEEAECNARQSGENGG